MSFSHSCAVLCLLAALAPRMISGGPYAQPSLPDYNLICRTKFSTHFTGYDPHSPVICSGHDTIEFTCIIDGQPKSIIPAYQCPNTLDFCINFNRFGHVATPDELSQQQWSIAKCLSPVRVDYQTLHQGSTQPWQSRPDQSSAAATNFAGNIVISGNTSNANFTLSWWYGKTPAVPTFMLHKTYDHVEAYNGILPLLQAGLEFSRWETKYFAARIEIHEVPVGSLHVDVSFGYW